jgi:hypothetical protein
MIVSAEANVKLAGTNGEDRARGLGGKPRQRFDKRRLYLRRESAMFVHASAPLCWSRDGARCITHVKLR